MTEINAWDSNVSKSSLLEKLITFGFTAAEAQVYLYLLENGIKTGGSKIAIGAKLHRQYVYLALPRLIESGLVEEVPYGKHAKYLAKSPQVIEAIGRRKALAASELARQLNQISNVGNEQEFEVIQGKRAIQQYELLYTEQTDIGEEECVIGGASKAFGAVMDDYLDEYLDVKAKKKIVVKYLGTSDERAFYQKYIGQFANQEYRFMEKLPHGVAHMVIRKDTVSFFSFLNPPLIYVIKSPVVAKNYKDFFMMLWEMAGE